ncbi:DNA repair exonuclease [Sulfitobacter sp. HNIBRBA3233]|uniref:metallophosphoesterase family protein n=1 Tax=Sulfitobacter marinivivus TaxID=3158558 RepID=UPI0032DF1730
MFRFLHSSDLHLGKPFGRFDEDVRGRLREARFDALNRLAQAARDGGAQVVLLAGDTFDQETPAPRLIRQTLNTMRAASDIHWVLMPGNHDSLAATELWQTIQRDRPDNLTLALSDAPVDLGAATLLPAPCTARNPGRDLTEAMGQPTAEGQIRIGLGHGGITEFAGKDGEGGDVPSGVIAPDRARRAGLDYLGFGDWHRQMRIDDRTWYSGTPEQDAFKHDTRGQALLVGIGGAGTAPEVTPVVTAALHWQRRTITVTPQEDTESLLDTVLPQLGARRDTLFALVGEGRLGVARMQTLRAGLRRAAPDFLHFEEDLTAVALAQEAADIEAIDASGGALRQAAERLATRAEDSALSQDDRKVAQDALSLLFGFAAEAGTA